MSRPGHHTTVDRQTDQIVGRVRTRVLNHDYDDFLTYVRSSFLTTPSSLGTSSTQSPVPSNGLVRAPSSVEVSVRPPSHLPPLRNTLTTSVYRTSERGTFRWEPVFLVPLSPYVLTPHSPTTLGSWTERRSLRTTRRPSPAHVFTRRHS